jgi:hypothetical protein
MTEPKFSDQARSGWPAEKANASRCFRFINPHRLFHGVWLPQWLEERPEISEKAKKLYAYLTYFAGGKDVLGRHSAYWPRNCIAPADT